MRQPVRSVWVADDHPTNHAGGLIVIGRYATWVREFWGLFTRASIPVRRHRAAWAGRLISGVRERAQFSLLRKIGPEFEEFRKCLADAVRIANDDAIDAQTGDRKAHCHAVVFVGADRGGLG